jgi:hypothetical protein
MPVNVVYLAMALMATLLVVAWIAGWKLGQTHQAQKDEPLIQRKGPAITEAGAESPELVSEIPRGPSGGGGGVAPQAEPVAGLDPREKGLNYLYLAVLSQPEAERAGKFLRDKGVEAYAVPWVDPKGSGANNAGPLYRLFVLPGVTGGDLKKSAAQNLQTEVARLGSVWQKEYRGTSNFGKLSWEKYQ